MHSVLALQKFPDNWLYPVTHIGTATFQSAISQKNVAVWFRAATEVLV